MRLTDIQNRKLVNRFRETGSVLDREPQRTHELTEEKLDEIGQTLERSPRKSLSRLSQETGVSQFSAWKATRPYTFEIKTI